MKRVSEFPKALKMFAKEVGLPEAIIGTNICVLEGLTQWANRAELYVGLFKEAVRKDMI